MSYRSSITFSYSSDAPETLGKQLATEGGLQHHLPVKFVAIP